MARPKKPTYEWIESRKEFRKRIKGPNGKYIALYAQTPEELTEKIAVVQRQIEEEVYRRENPTVKDYAEKWLTIKPRTSEPLHWLTTPPRSRSTS